MTWQLILAFTVTLPALLLAGLLTLSVFYRRYKVFHFNRQRYLEGPRHIDHEACRCHFCLWDKAQAVD